MRKQLGKQPKVAPPLDLNPMQCHNPRSALDGKREMTARKKTSKLSKAANVKRARKQIVLSITDDYPYLKRDLEKLARGEKRSTSSYACMVLSAHIDGIRKK